MNNYDKNFQSSEGKQIDFEDMSKQFVIALPYEDVVSDVLLLPSLLEGSYHVAGIQFSNNPDDAEFIWGLENAIVVRNCASEITGKEYMIFPFIGEGVESE